MSAENCHIAYDHNDEDECAVCGWNAEVETPPTNGPRDMSTLTGPEKIREAIARLEGHYAPTQPFVVCDRRDELS